jgi:hypothetical protein
VNVAPGSLLRQPFYTTLVKKSQEANGASEHLRTPLPRTRVHKGFRTFWVAAAS